MTTPIIVSSDLGKTIGKFHGIGPKIVETER